MKTYVARCAQCCASTLQQGSRHDRNSQTEQPPTYGVDFADSQLQPIQRVAAPAQVVEQDSTAGNAPNPTGLPDALKAGVEALSGYSLDPVRVHFNSGQPAQINALAYTQGTEIHIAPGQERYLPHEAWHVVQQAQGRVQATMQMKAGVNINDDEGLEQEADVMGAKADATGQYVFVQKKSFGLGTQQSSMQTVPFQQQALKSTAGNSSVWPVQRHIFIRNKQAAPKPAKVAIAAFRQFLEEESLTNVKQTARDHPIFALMRKKAYAGREEAILQIIETWLDDDQEEGRTFANWEKALEMASLESMTQEAHKARSPEELAKQKMEFQKLLGGFSASNKEKIADQEPRSKREREDAEKLKPLTRQASLVTDIFGTPKGDDDPLFLPIKRRKMHKSGKTDLPGYKLRYRTYEGTISPKPNAFVLGGNLPTDYGPLLSELVNLIRLDFAKKELPLPSDRIIAGLFLEEMAGKDAFSGFPKEVQTRAHKVIAIILFAEFSRHSIALVSAAAAFHSIATRGEKAAEPALVESFETGTGKERPLFAGTGGAEVMRNESTQVKDMSEAELITRRARGVVDLLNFLHEHQQKGEELGDVLKRKTLEYLFALAKHTDERSYKAAELNHELYRHLHRVQAAGDNPMATLAQLGFTHHEQPGDENDCAIYTLYDQLTRRHGQLLGDRAAFVNFVRGRVGVPIGVMIDLVAQGQALLNAANAYITEVLHRAPLGLAINVWASTGDGGLMEFNNVAVVGGHGVLACVFYYNGVNHFDSLSGGPDI